MRIIPVLDLKDGLAVHAVRGERASYAPVQSVLAPGADPVGLARAFRARLGCAECYVADLDAIMGRRDHADVAPRIARLGLTVWLDAGLATAADVGRMAGLGVGRVVVGTETLRHPDELPAIVAAAAAVAGPPGLPCVLSLDLREGVLLGGSPDVARLDPLDLAARGWTAGFRAFIVLDLARVGSGGGVQTGAAARLRQALPAAEIVVGGGVRGAADLRDLAGQGFDGALVATALHAGAIAGPWAG